MLHFFLFFKKQKIAADNISRDKKKYESLVCLIFDGAPPHTGVTSWFQTSASCVKPTFLHRNQVRRSYASSTIDESPRRSS